MSDEKQKFEDIEDGGKSSIGEFFQFLREERKYWLIPFVAVLFLVGLLIIVSSGAGAPFIYTFF